MKRMQLEKQAGYVAAIAIAAVLVLMPFHATLTVWLSQVVGHYTALRLWKEMLLIPLGLYALYILWQNPALRARFLRFKLTSVIGAYLAVQVMWGLAAYYSHEVTLKALGYGWVSNTRYLVFFLLVWVVAHNAAWLKSCWQRLVLWPAVVVVLFGLLQFFVLPYDFLAHLGYSAATIFPYSDINHNIHYIRVMSTLRGSNPFGAYLALVLTLVLATLVTRKSKARALLALLGASGTLTLILTFSRGAWLGLVAGIAVLLWARLTSSEARKLTFAAVGIFAILAASFVFVVRDNVTFQNIFFHTQTHSLVRSTSDAGHISAFESGMHDIVHEPLGRGPGTAGPASYYNIGHPFRLAENYFIQVGQETGWLGLGLFLAINVLIARALWRRRSNALALGLFAALAGLVVVNLLSHAWADDTLAYLWWGLAGIACAVSPTASTETVHTHKRLSGLQAFDGAVKRRSQFASKKPVRELYAESIARKHTV